MLAEFSVYSWIHSPVPALNPGRNPNTNDSNSDQAYKYLVVFGTIIIIGFLYQYATNSCGGNGMALQTTK